MADTTVFTTARAGDALNKPSPEAGGVLSSLGLSAEALASRCRSIGGSDANTIMAGNNDWRNKLWAQKTRRAEASDLSGNLAVQMGSFTEPLNIAWFEKQTGLRVQGAQTALRCALNPYRTATLDGLVFEQGAAFPCAIFEAKHVGADANPGGVLAKYRPQLQHNMDVAGLNTAFLSVLSGNGVWFHHRLASDPAYADELLTEEWRFWLSVQSDVPPVAHAEAPVFDPVDRWDEPLPPPPGGKSQHWSLWSKAMCAKIGLTTTVRQIDQIAKVNHDALRACPGKFRGQIAERFASASMENADQDGWANDTPSKQGRAA